MAIRRTDGVRTTAAGDFEFYRKHWPLIGAIFQDALALPPARRPSFVATRANDERIVREVIRLLQLHDSAADFLEAPILPLVDRPAFILRPGELISSRFEIVRPLGRGGMGEVYEAWDRVLAERVALKLMRSDVGRPEAMLERFRQEVQLARRISHPSVCRVHDVAFHTTPNDERFIVLTMELLDGETLAQRLRRGPLPEPEALDVCSQLAAALDAAHGASVIHRDIKPDNVFLERRADGRTRAVLTDFGLARVFDDAQRDRSRDVEFGTPHYMAPELFEGEPPTIQSDVYALALVMKEAMPPGRGVAVLDRGTEADPRRRTSSAGELAAALSASTLAPPPRANVGSLLMLAALAAAVASLLGFLRLSQQGEAVVRPPDRVVILPTVNRTTEADLDGIVEVLRSQLVQSTTLEPIAPQRLYEALRRMRRDPGMPMTSDVAREIALREGAVMVVYSALEQHGPTYRLGLALEGVGSRPSSTPQRWQRTFVARGREALFAAAHDAASWVRRTAGEGREALADQDRPPSETTTSSWEALRLYVKANERHASGDTAAALLLLEQALRIDPAFAAAHMRRADLLLSQRRDGEGYAAWREAIRLTERHQVTSREHLQINAQYLEDTGDWPAAEKAYRTYLVHYPADPEAAFRLGSTLAALGQSPEALTWFDRALQLRPTWNVPVVHAVRVLLDEERFDEALQRLDVLDRQGEREWALWLRGLHWFVKGDVQRALRAIGPLSTSDIPQWRSRAFALRAAWLVETGDPVAAERELKEGTAFDASQGLHTPRADKLLHLASLYRLMHRGDEAVEAARDAVIAAPTTTVRLAAATAAARAGRPRDARELAAGVERHDDLPRLRAAWHRLLGEIEMAQERPREAMAFFEVTAALDPLHRSREYLARALIAAGDPTAAAAVIDNELRHPVYFYRSPDGHPGGAWGELMNVAAQVIALLDPQAATRFRERHPRFQGR